MGKGADVLFPEMKVIMELISKGISLPESTGVNDRIFIVTL